MEFPAELGEPVTVVRDDLLGGPVEARPQEVEVLVERLQAGLDGAAEEIVADHRHRLSELGGELHRLSPKARLGVAREKLDQLGKRLTSAGFESVLARGYSIVRDADGAVISTREGVTPGRKLRLKFGDGEAAATGG